jgi:DNA-damage-inducible protein D
MDDLIESEPHRHTMERLEAAKRTTPGGVGYWMARELGPILGYPTWGKFEPVVLRAAAALRADGRDPSHQIAQAGKSVGREDSRDYFLTRAASYLIAMNGEPSKPEIAAAQIYFAARTRQMELEDQKSDDVKRLEARERVRQSHRRVSGAAQSAGVRNQMQGVFHDAGSKGLYGGLSRADVKRLKGLSDTDNLYDHAGPLELSANDFLNNLSADVIERERISHERVAIKRHESVGGEVREAMKKSGARMPENLPKEPEPISAVAKRVKAQERARLKGPTS